MKKVRFGLLLMFVLLFSITVTAMAADKADFDEQLGWEVTYNGEKLNSTSDTGKLEDILENMQPGDSVLFTVDLKNNVDKETNWWMHNSVVQSLEEAQGVAEKNRGAYTYILSYNGEDIYNNGVVGGEKADNGVGLHEATGALEDYFYLDTLKKGQSGKVTLYVELDGLSQGNAYQEAKAILNMQFAVEEIATKEVVVTGDTTNTLPLFIGAGASGIVLLVAAILLFRRGKANREGGAKA